MIKPDRTANLHLAAFLEDNTRRSQDERQDPEALYHAYIAWTQNLSFESFKSAMAQLGYKQEEGQYIGISLPSIDDGRSTNNEAQP